MISVLWCFVANRIQLIWSAVMLNLYQYVFRSWKEICSGLLPCLLYMLHECISGKNEKAIDRGAWYWSQNWGHPGAAFSLHCLENSELLEGLLTVLHARRITEVEGRWERQSRMTRPGFTKMCKRYLPATGEVMHVSLDLPGNATLTCWLTF